MFILWVGGIDDYYKTRQEAQEAMKEWQGKGYTDLIIEEDLTI